VGRFFGVTVVDVDVVEFPVEFPVAVGTAVVMVVTLDMTDVVDCPVEVETMVVANVVKAVVEVPFPEAVPVAVAELLDDCDPELVLYSKN